MAVEVMPVEIAAMINNGDDGIRTGLMVEADPTNEATVFASGVHGAYNTYQAKAHVGEDTWFVGLRRRTGMPKPGPLTRPEQKAARFLPVRPASGEGGSGGGGGGGAPL
ncbi:Fibroblast growth factor [Gryllus bimaculatus]|nr:Fibroblast growth factor [Gryllus bimaculatus]